MTDIQEWLDKGRALADQATQGPWEADGCEVTQHWSRPEPWQTIVSTEVACATYCYGGSAEGVTHEEDAVFIADARTRLPLALAALQAVHDLHKRIWLDGREYCKHCADWGGEYPCPTVRATLDAIKETQA